MTPVPQKPEPQRSGFTPKHSSALDDPSYQTIPLERPPFDPNRGHRDFLAAQDQEGWRKRVTEFAFGAPIADVRQRLEEKLEAARDEAMADLEAEEPDPPKPKKRPPHPKNGGSRR